MLGKPRSDKDNLAINPMKLANFFIIILFFFAFFSPVRSADVKSAQECDPKWHQSNFDRCLKGWDQQIRTTDLKIQAFSNSIETQKNLEKYTVKMYNKQMMLTIALTIVVIAFIIFAIIFSYMQFRLDERLGRENSSSIKISAQGIELTSSVIGLFILLAAMIFLNLYVKEIYTIHQLPTNSSPIAKNDAN